MIPGRKVSGILKRGTLKIPCQKIPLAEFVFKKKAGMGSRPAFWGKKLFPAMVFSYGYISKSQFSEFWALFRSSLTWNLILVKLWAVHRSVLKRCYTEHVLKNILLRLLFSEHLPKRICGEVCLQWVCSLDNVSLQLYWNKLHIRRFLKNF